MRVFLLELKQLLLLLLQLLFQLWPVQGCFHGQEQISTPPHKLLSSPLWLEWLISLLLTRLFWLWQGETLSAARALTTNLKSHRFTTINHFYELSMCSMQWWYDLHCEYK